MANPDLPGITVNGGYSPDEFWLYQQQLQDLYQYYADQAANVPLPAVSGLPGAPYVQQAEPIEEVLVSGTRESFADTGRKKDTRPDPIPLDPEGFPPSWAMNDQEYVDYLGGGDSAYEQMWAERHPNEPEETFAPPYTIPPALLEPALSGLGLGAQILAGLTGLIGLLVPLQPGPREFDEAPTLPPRPPRTPLPPFDEPLPPNWEDLANEPHNYGFEPEFDEFPDTIIVNPPRRDTVERFQFPIGDYPGMFDPAPGLPYFPQPEFFPQPAPRPRPIAIPQPAGPTLDPYSDPLPFQFDDPSPFAAPQPRVSPGPDPIGDPFPGLRPFPDPFGDPFAPPRTDSPPRAVPRPVDIPLPGDPFFPDTPYAPPQFTYTPFDPAVDPTLPQFDPDKTDACNCTAQKAKKKKSKKKPRTVCYRGTYEERSNGLTKKRLEEIPCAPGGRGSAARNTPRKKLPVRRPAVPSLPDLARDVFQLPRS